MAPPLHGWLRTQHYPSCPLRQPRCRSSHSFRDRKTGGVIARHGQCQFSTAAAASGSGSNPTRRRHSPPARRDGGRARCGSRASSGLRRGRGRLRDAPCARELGNHPRLGLRAARPRAGRAHGVAVPGKPAVRHRRLWPASRRPGWILRSAVTLTLLVFNAAREVVFLIPARTRPGGRARLRRPPDQWRPRARAPRAGTLAVVLDPAAAATGAARDRAATSSGSTSAGRRSPPRCSRTAALGVADRADRRRRPGRARRAAGGRRSSAARRPEHEARSASACRR